MSTLRDSHSYLFKRVRLKLIMHIFLGLIFAFFPDEVGVTQRHSALNVHIPLAVFGYVYLVLALFILIGIFRSTRDFLLLRRTLFCAALYSTFWVGLMFILLVTDPGKGTAWGFAMYSYLTYNLWIIFRDPGWKAISIIDKYKRSDDATSLVDTTV